MFGHGRGTGKICGKGWLLIPIGREAKKAPARRCDEGKAVDPLRESRKGHSTEGRM